MNTRMKQALFGGALCAAGITTAAQGQWEIDPSVPFGTGTQVLSYDIGGSLIVNNYSFGASTSAANFDSINDPAIGGAASATASNAYVGANLNITSGSGGVAGDAYAYVTAIAVINVNFDKKVQASWDFTGVSGGFSDANIFAYDSTDAVFLLNAEVGTSGSMSLDLLADHDYVFQVRVRDDTESTLWGMFTKAEDDCLADITDSTGSGPDGVVDVFDLLELLGNWGTNGNGADIAPATNIVDVFDLLDLLAAWGEC